MKKGPPFTSKWKDGPYELLLIPDGGGRNVCLNYLTSTFLPSRI